ncbi:hypothetical protein [Achromobacter xylosoxidans]|uniref:hypothetical protein n=1 Tax=Alcaligenes xylosoxydans xylosoxydans TaxID=85698 RepID=UPI0038FD1074
MNSPIKLPPLPAPESPAMEEYADGWTTWPAQPDYYTEKQLLAYAEQAIRDALAAQTPNVWGYVVNGAHRQLSDIEPPSDAYDIGSLQRFALIPESRHE